ncbi:hypothetical protein, partial [Pseudomonas putida]|uniref:hypothetical protein n=1 Tax=Pseudomonas putida TaxID=303 RepID=UPI00211758A7
MNEYLLDVNAHIQEARSKKQEARSKFVCFDSANSPFAMAMLTHLFALTASHFLSNATKSNQKTLRSHHPAPALRSGV